MRRGKSHLAFVIGAAMLGASLAAPNQPAVLAQEKATETAKPKKAAADEKSGKTAETPEQSISIAETVLPSLVRVEYTLQFDQGEAPQSAGWSERCPNCGGYHGNGSADALVNDERPMETGGFLVAADTVITPDPIMHPRFIKSIAVRFGDETVPATVKSIGKDRPALVLSLSKPLKQAKPLQFDADRKGPYHAVTYAAGSGDWVVRVTPAGGAVSLTTSDRKFAAVPSFSLVTDGKGQAVGLSMRDELPLDGSWKGTPADWPMHSADELAALNKRIEQIGNAGLVQVTLNFRSPRATNDMNSMRFGPTGADDENATVRHATGVLVDNRTVLVLLDLKSKQTARLEKVRVQGAKGDAVEAKFARTLSDYGALVVTLDKPMKGAIKAAATDSPQPLRAVMLPVVEILLQGDQRTQYIAHRRISGFNPGFRRQLTPDLPYTGDKSMFLFNDAGELVALPIARRDKSVDDDRYSYRGSDRPSPVLVGYIWPAIKGDAKTYADANNVPLTEAEENRLAWLGVELQALTPDLARENGISSQTSDGQNGALVTYVYADSPAAKAGIEPGQILLRLHVADRPKPIDIQVDQSPFGDQPFPWEQFDQLTEQYFDRVPAPWPNVENRLTRVITDLGFGKKFELEVAVDGKIERKSFEVAEGPGYYESATKLKFEPLGVTVKELTYENRRYFQIPEGQPGLIIGKIEMGSRASTSGLKPYELITHVNDQPVATVKQFEEKAKGQTSLRLSVKRMNKSRQVNVTVEGKADEVEKTASDEPSKDSEKSPKAEKPETAKPEKAKPEKKAEKAKPADE